MIKQRRFCRDLASGRDSEIGGYPLPGCRTIASGLSAILTLQDYVRLARHSPAGSEFQ